MIGNFLILYPPKDKYYANKIKASAVILHQNPLRVHKSWISPGPKYSIKGMVHKFPYQGFCHC
ncbi:hypothetical protein NSE_0670 [Neorickettsia sennetsu str. Miyayama]|uniref:Uncharacterized protein n=1 Tax=Ehrlichia sennetsu (strain ATCC VR-367 / Miyayama) TaxID=222891 RepID=Q2GD98_EHRS3|nr:hypothetical protein NSE_0670 [Neorickettsia sennetsu str. Miyayama]